MGSAVFLLSGPVRNTGSFDVFTAMETIKKTDVMAVQCTVMAAVMAALRAVIFNAFV
jgi:hypothetical protein